MSEFSTGAAQIAEQMLEEAQQAAAQAEKMQPKAIEGPQFNEVLDSQRVAGVQETRPGAIDVLRAAQQADAAPAVPAIGQSMNQSSAVMTGVHRIMEDVMQGQNKLEEIISLSLTGRNFSTNELLALQAGVYRFTQELELTSKVVEKGTSTVKQTMNTQV